MSFSREIVLARLASPSPGQLNGFGIHVPAPQTGEPSELKMVPDHHPTQFLETRQRHVKRVVNEIDELYSHVRKRSQILLHTRNIGQTVFTGAHG